MQKPVRDVRKPLNELVLAEAALQAEITEGLGPDRLRALIFERMKTKYGVGPRLAAKALADAIEDARAAMARASEPSLRRPGL